MRACACVHARACMRVRACMHARMRVCMCVCVRACVGTGVLNKKKGGEGGGREHLQVRETRLVERVFDVCKHLYVHIEFDVSIYIMYIQPYVYIYICIVHVSTYYICTCIR